MKETGIVRRIDELGRVVIPKEIRRTLRLKESDPLEIFTERDMLCFKKYSPITSIADFAEGICATLNDFTGRLALVTDGDVVLCAKGQRAKEYIGERIVKEVYDILAARRAVYLDGATEENTRRLTMNGEKPFDNLFIAPSVSGGDMIGGVILCGGERFTDVETVLVRSCADILSRQF